MWVNATGNSSFSPWIQVVFVTETTVYDGAYDPSVSDYGNGVNGPDPCGGPCAESDGVPFITHNIAQIAQGITQKNVGVASSSHVTFSMVDYFSTLGADHDDGDGSEYNVDVSTFEPASTFATTVTSMASGNTLFGSNWVSAKSVYGDADFSDNFLSSSMITALYGALHGSGLTWVNNASTYHVVVWVGSTLPRDSAYQGNWCVTYNDYAGACQDPTSTTEPAYTYASGLTSPAGETLANIAALAQQEHVIIDTIDLPDGMTLLGSKDYVNTGTAAQGNVNAILKAGCYLAQQTGGSWEGPTPTNTGTGFTCSAAPAGSGGAGNLTNTFRTSANGNWLWADNPSLAWALTNINFPATHTNYSVIAYTSEESFQYTPTPGFSIDSKGMVYSCTNNGTDISKLCAKSWNASIGQGGWGWGWPLTAFYPDDIWSVSFQVNVSNAFPTAKLNSSIPIDSCLNTTQWTGCGGPQGTLYTEVKYTNYTKSATNQSFPPAYVDVVSNGQVPSLSGVTITPSGTNISYGGSQSFTATPVCNGGSCPAGTTFTWSSTNGSMGSLSGFTGSTVSFTAGAVNGTLALFVNATLYSLTHKSSPAMIKVVPPVALTGVYVTPAGQNLTVGGSANFTATPVCSGGSCPPGGIYAWNLTNSLGSLSSGVGNPISVTAGSSPGNVTLFVNATLNGVKKQSLPIPISITPVSAPTLLSVSITRNSSAPLSGGGSQTFSAVPSCSSPGCANTPSYLWTFTNGALGTLSSSFGSPVVFTARNTSGNVSLFVNATLNGKVVMGGPVLIMIVVTPPSAAIDSVAVSPSGDTLPANAVQSFAAVPKCPIACTFPIIYTWSLTSGLGKINSTTGSPVTFTAGTTAGVVSLFVNASGGGTTVMSPPAVVTITVTPPSALKSVLVSPASDSLPVGSSTVFTAAIGCAGSCPTGTTYSWSLTTTRYGMLASASGNPVIFQAGTRAGTTVLFVNATLNQVTVQSAPIVVTVQAGSAPTLAYVTISPQPPPLDTGASLNLTAIAICTGSGCPASVTYAWRLSGSGALAPSTGSNTVFTAGSSAGTVTLTVTATLNGQSVSNETVIKVVSQGGGTTGASGLSPTTYLLVGLSGGIAIAVIAVIFGARRRRQHVQKLQTEPAFGLG